MAQLRVQATLLLEVNEETGEVDSATVMPQNHGEWVEDGDEWELGTPRVVISKMKTQAELPYIVWEF